MQTLDPFPGHYLDDDPFGSMDGRRYPHTGSDWGRSIGGKWIPAPAAGVVVAVGYNPGNGNYVCWRLENGLYLAALHLAEPSPLSEGDRVELGQGVGVVGATGSNANGPHLHLTLSDSPLAYLGMGNKQDPWAFIQAHLADTTVPATTTTHRLTQEEIDEMASVTPAFVVRNYEYEGTFGKVATALGYPDGTLQKLEETDDVDGAVEAHAKVFHIAPDNDAEKQPRNKYVQLTDRQFKALVAQWPGKIV